MKTFEEISRFMITGGRSRQLVIVSKSDTSSLKELKSIIGIIVTINNKLYRIKDVEPQELILKKGGRICLMSCLLPLNYEEKAKNQIK